MKKLILIAALTVIGLTGKVYAQNGYTAGALRAMNTSKADLTFNTWDSWINIRDFVTLKEGRMILELNDLSDYQDFRNLDSILTGFRKDIAFYKDSLNSNPTGNMRIDYAINSEYTYKKIRVRKYNPNGSMFVNKDGDISRLKFEQDTVRIIIHKSREGFGIQKCTIPYSIQVTFLLDNYYDVDKVIADNVLKGIVDTLEKRSFSKKAKKFIYRHPVTIKYNPYFTGKNIKVYRNLLMENELAPNAWSRRKFDVNFSMGAGLVRSTVVPVTELGLQWNHYVGKVNRDRDFVRLSVSPYFFFDKDMKGDFVMNDNWFINLSTGSIYESNGVSWLGKEATFGIGYLAINKGGYFKNTTLKIFTDLLIRPKFTIEPEIIITDNFKQIFPGFTVKVF